MSRGIKTNLLGKNIGYLQVIAEAPASGKLTRWLCKCICGTEVIKYANDLKKNRLTTSCGCKFNDSLQRLSPIEKSASRIFHANYKSDSDFSFKEFMILSQGNCHYCNGTPSNSFCSKKGGAPFIYNGLDRLDSSIGHTKNNCVPCCKWCNVSKNTRTVFEFLEWVKSVYKKNN